MEFQTASQVSQNYGISTRMLRYYEQAGLLESGRKDDYAYRVYDEAALKRLQQIIILRKLQIPIKQISTILSHPDAATAIDIFKANISELQSEINALSTIKSALEIFVVKIEELAVVRLNLDLLNDESVTIIAESLSLIQKNLKERSTMDEINKATEQVNKLADKDVRIVYLPPATVASIHFIGDRPEDRASAILREFMLKTDLANLKPDFRHYGFNHPSGSNDDDHGYEYWVTIPENMVIEPPFQKKEYAGGLYAAHAITFGDFEKWHWLWEWVAASDKFTFNLGDPECMDGCIEEHINYFNQFNLNSYDKDKFQMDLLIPVKEK